MANALTSGLKTYGEFRTRIGVIVAVIASIFMCICGWMIVLGKDTHTMKTKGTLSNVSCTSNVCTATVEYTIGTSTFESPAPSPSQSPAPAPAPVSANTYKITLQVLQNSKEGQVVDVYYNPENPNDASLGTAPKVIGWGLIGGATLIIILSILFMKFFSGLSNQGKAIVGGFEAVGNISSLLRKN